MAVAVALYLEQPLPLYADDQSVQPVPQSEQSEQSTGVKEVIVTGTRRKENVENVPYNINVVDSQTIEQLQLTKISDALHYTPGVSLQDEGTYGPGNVVMRGLNTGALGPAEEVGPNGDAGAVTTYMGEVPIFYDFRLLDINRVEVLQGPQGTLYGAGSLGGVIRYVPNEPDLSKFQADVHLRVTALEEATPPEGYNGDVMFNVPLIDGVLGFRAVVGLFHDPGFINTPLLVRVPGVSLPQPNFNDPSAVAANLFTERGVNFDHTVTARAELLYKPADSFEAEMTYMHQSSTTGGLPVEQQSPLMQTLGIGPFDDASRVPQTSDRSIDLASLVLTGHFGFADLVSASTYSLRKVHQISDATDNFITTPYTHFPAFVAINDSQDTQNTYTEELRLVSSGESRFNWIVGGFYEFWRNGPSPFYTYMPGYPAYIGVDRPDQVQSYEFGFENFSDRAIFGELGYHFTPAWQVTVGGRYFTDHIDESSFSSSPLTDGSPPNGFNLIPYYISAPSHTASIWKLNTSYRFTPNLMLYATLNQGYRSPQLNQPPAICGGGITANCLPIGDVLIKPDRTHNYELGVHSTWFDRHLVVNGDVYYIAWNDLRVPLTYSPGLDYIGNAGGALSKGFELQVQGQLSSRLQLLGSYSYNAASLTTVLPNGDCNFFTCTDGEPGDRLPGTPKQMAALNLRYTHDLPDGYALAGSWAITAQSNIFSQVGDRIGIQPTPGYALQNASLDLIKENWTVTFFVQNLFNKYAATGQDSDPSYKDLVVNGIIARIYDYSITTPRQFGLEARVKFR